jgi:hypothetical protein
VSRCRRRVRRVAAWERNISNNSRPMPQLPLAGGTSILRCAQVSALTSASSAPVLLSSARCRRRAFAERSAAMHFRRHVDRGGHRARGARHAAVGDQRDLVAVPLQRRQRGVSLCSSGMPFARGPWPRTTTTTSRLSSPALNAALTASCVSKMRAGASTLRRSGFTAETLITARPRLPAAASIRHRR